MALANIIKRSEQFKKAHFYGKLDMAKIEFFMNFHKRAGTINWEGEYGGLGILFKEEIVTSKPSLQAGHH